jgi:glucose/arabinose dehydrogenase
MMMTMMRLWFGAIVLLACLAPTVSAQVSLVRTFPALTFSSPVDLQNAGDGTNRLFVVERSGRIRVFPNNPSVASSSVFLDITDKVRAGGELGLLGLAFHPQYASNGFFYVNYTRGFLGNLSNPLRSVIARYQVSADPNHADSLSEQVLLEFSQPYENHNGGQLAFGPDGYLYIATGDGGSGGDPQNNAQNRSILLGKILRIDVSGTPYAIPPTNPFAGNVLGYREEIYAYGLRNPWRFSFDPQTGWLWAADVGQGLWEEIDIVTAGRNYGWRIMEGFECYNASSCDTSGLTLPIWSYYHEPLGGYSVTGGYVYRGSFAPGLVGKYIYGDYVTQRIWALSYDGTGPASNESLLTAPASVSSFGVDETGELYVVDLNGGGLYRFDSASSAGGQGPLPSMFRLRQNYPNPFNGQTVIPFSLPSSSDIAIMIYDIRGREVRRLTEGAWGAGEHSVQWDGTDGDGRALSSGLYTVQLVVDGTISDARSMTLLK